MSGGGPDARILEEKLLSILDAERCEDAGGAVDIEVNGTMLLEFKDSSVELFVAAVYVVCCDEYTIVEE